jgi:hypothetical protein
MSGRQECISACREQEEQEVPVHDLGQLPRLVQQELQVQEASEGLKANSTGYRH